MTMNLRACMLVIVVFVVVVDEELLKKDEVACLHACLCFNYCCC